MPYCPECGIHYLQPNSTCVSCGRDLSAVLNSPDLKSETSGKTVEPDPPQNEPIIDFSGFRPQVESHLGKGIVKPQSVEVGADGFHFKYDQPPHRLVKSETLKDKNVEFRVTAPMDPPEQFLAKASAAPMNPPEQILTKESATPMDSYGSFLAKESDALMEPQEQLLENQSANLEQLFEEEPTPMVAREGSEQTFEPEGPEEPVGPENLIKPGPTVELETDIASVIHPVIEIEVEDADRQLTEEPESSNETDFRKPVEIDPDKPDYLEYAVDEPAPELPEPELKGFASEREEEPEAVWVGKGSWYGFGAKTQYRITNQTVVIIEPHSYRFTEFELALVSNIKLNRTWLMKLLGIGDVSMTIIGLPEPGLTLKGIREPEKVKRMLEELIITGSEERGA